MGALQLDIMKVKQILSLLIKGDSNRQIAEAIGVSRNTVNDYVKKLKSVDLSYQTLFDKDELDLQKLFPSKESLDSVRYANLLNMFPHFTAEMKKPGCTRQHLWNKYREEHIEHYGYSRFCELFSAWQESKKVSGKLNHISGDKLYIDYTGKKLHIVNKSTGEVIDVEVFVAVLPASQYTYVEASYNQKRESFVDSVSNCLEFLGGVPKAIVPDNLKSAVTKASKYEPIINKTFRDMANHYSCVINPARAYSPQDKALVESAVKLVYQRIFYPMSNMTFFSLSDLNKQIKILLTGYNNYKLQTLGISRFKQFVDIEKEYLGALPNIAYSVKNYNRAKVQKMGYIYLSEQKNYYSVPYRYIGKFTEIQHNANTVEVFYNKERIASHIKSYAKGHYITNNQHLSSTHNFYQSWNKEFFLKLASKIGSNTVVYIEKLIDSQPYPEIGYKRSNGIISLKRKFSRERLEAACEKALNSDLQYYSYKLIENILKNKTDQEAETQEVTHNIDGHENLRNSNIYK